jgi:ABC-type nitrate/sulfonate/bicarbonate transport system substrate-binding protein
VAIEFRNLPMNTENQRPLINLLCLGAVGLSAIVLSIAHRRELFKKHGANVHLIPVPGTQLPELTITNPVGHIGAPATIMRAAGGAELKILASLDSGRLSNHLVVSPDIAKPEDLRGKCLGARVTGAALWINTVLALEQLGLDLKRDNINIVPIGDPSHIMRALEERRIDGAVLSTAQSRELTAKGFSVLLDLSSANVHGAQDALVATTAFLGDNPKAAEGLVAGLIEGTAFALSQNGKPTTLETIRTELLITDHAAAEDGLLQLSKVMTRKPYPSIERLCNMQRIMSTVDPKVLQVDIQGLVDDRFVRNLDQSGFIDSTYAAYNLV